MCDDINYGPLTQLIGTWQGDKGLDIAPEPDGTEENPYYETITFEAIGDVENAETQTLAIVHYTQVVQRKSNDEVFHHQSGYFTWDTATDEITHSFSIPRGVALIATGKASINDDNICINLRSEASDIAQAPFMQKEARTIGFTQQIIISQKQLSYTQTTMLEIYQRSFEHTDQNTLIGEN